MHLIYFNWSLIFGLNALDSKLIALIRIVRAEMERTNLAEQIAALTAQVEKLTKALADKSAIIAKFIDRLDGKNSSQPEDPEMETTPRDDTREDTPKKNPNHDHHHQPTPTRRTARETKTDSKPSQRKGGSVVKKEKEKTKNKPRMLKQNKQAQNHQHRPR